MNIPLVRPAPPQLSLAVAELRRLSRVEFSPISDRSIRFLSRRCSTAFSAAKALA